jgi:hypothetical protein
MPFWLIEADLIQSGVLNLNNLSKNLLFKQLDYPADGGNINLSTAFLGLFSSQHFLKFQESFGDFPQ